VRPVTPLRPWNISIDHHLTRRVIFRDQNLMPTRALARGRGRQMHKLLARRTTTRFRPILLDLVHCHILRPLPSLPSRIFHRPPVKSPRLCLENFHIQPTKPTSLNWQGPQLIRLRHRQILVLGTEPLDNMVSTIPPVKPHRTKCPLRHKHRKSRTDVGRCQQNS
jgi:hypothetical protein